MKFFKLTKKMIIMMAVLTTITMGILSFRSFIGKKPPELNIFKVEKKTIRDVVSTTAVVEPMQRLVIKPSIEGRIEKVLVKEGNRVKKGDILAWMSSTDRAVLMDMVKAKGKDSKEVSNIEEIYKEAPIVAYHDGIIISKNIDEGQSVTQNDEAFVLYDKYILLSKVDETDLAKIFLKQKVDITLDAYPDYKFNGKVGFIAYESTMLNNVITYKVKIMPDNVPNYIRSGMTANIELVVNEKENVLSLPEEAIISREGDLAKVLKIVQSTERPFDLKRTEIVIGASNSKTTEVISGLSENDRIAVVLENSNIENKSKDVKMASIFENGNNEERGERRGPPPR